jgi:hypothetical protein
VGEGLGEGRRIAVKNPVRNGVLGLILGVTLCGAEPVWAQNDPVAQQAPPGVVKGGGGLRQQRQVEYGPMLSVNFQGGTLESYIAALQKAAGDKPVNVVTPAVAKRVELPAIVLRDVTLYTALSAVCSVFEENSEHRFRVGPIGSDTEGAFSLSYVRVGSRNSNPFGVDESKIKHLQVYSVRDLIDPAMEGGVAESKVAYEDIISAVETAMKLLDQEEMPRMMFHKQTGLLMVGGTLEQNSVVDTLLSRIRDDMQRRWSEERAGRKSSTDKQRRMVLAQSQVRVAELEMQQTADRLKRMQTLVDAGQGSRDDLDKARVDAEKAMAALERAKIEAEAIGEELAATGPIQTVQYDISELLKRDPTVTGKLRAYMQRDSVKVETGLNGTQLRVRGSAEELAKVSQILDRLNNESRDK